jgi:hypothetical protein
LSHFDRNLSRNPDAIPTGLECDTDGVYLAGVPLLKRSFFGLEPRPREELSALLRAAYGQEAGRLDPGAGLLTAAKALNADDAPRALVACLHLRLPALSQAGASRLVEAYGRLRKYSPDQPRDWRGRWTTEGGAGPAPTSSGQTAPAISPVTSARFIPDIIGQGNPPTTLGFGSRTPRYWREQLRFLADQPEVGGNGPPEEIPETILPEAEPNANAPKVPERWDVGGFSSGGLLHPIVRRPTLSDGKPWPEATPQAVVQILNRMSGRKPTLRILLPFDNIGPTLLGETEKEDFRTPEGYYSVTFVGRPQISRSGDPKIETEHANESVREALQYIRGVRSTRVYFNMAASSISPNAATIRLRPDIVVEHDTTVQDIPQYRPYEILSPRQTIEQRRVAFPGIPGFVTIDGHHYKVVVSRWGKLCLLPLTM